jgi:hypothetical protein
MIASTHPRSRYLTANNVYVAGSFVIMLGYLTYYLLR